MASLSLDNAEIVRAVLQVTGLGRTAADMDTATEADVRHIIRSGLKRFFFPTIGEFVYQWRFLEKHHAIPAVNNYETGTVAVSGGTVTLTGGTWPSDITDYFLSVDGHVLFVITRTDDTHVEVSHTQLTVAAGEAFVAYKYRYSLPSDFGEWLGGVVYSNGDSDDDNRELSVSTEAELRLRYAIGQGQSSRTTHYAITSAPDADDFRIMLFPVPETNAFIQGVYLSVPNDNLPADLTVPGSTIQVKPMYAEAVLGAILAAAEEYNNDENGVHSQRFEIALQKAIAHDKAIGGAYDFSKPLTDPRGLGPVISEIDFSSQL